MSPFCPCHRYVNLVQFTEKTDSKAKLNEELAKIVQEYGTLDQKGSKSMKSRSFLPLSQICQPCSIYREARLRIPAQRGVGEDCTGDGTPGEEGSQVQEGQ